MSKDKFGLTPEDMDEFRRAMEKMHEENVKKSPEPEQSEDYYDLTGVPARGKIEVGSLELTEREQYGPEDIMTHTRPGVQHKIFTRLKRGQMSPGASIDFHGKTASEAADSLAYFLEQCHLRGIKVARIIHGKGNRSKDGIPILKNLTNQWLKERADVLAFCSAPPRDGGAGAVYVLLKKL